MSISSHLTPEPERRLWIILETMRRAVETSDKKIAALTAFAAAELALIRLLAPASPAAVLGRLCLFAALPLGIFAFSPLTSKPQRLPPLDPPVDRPQISDCLIAVDDIAKYAHGELIHRLDKYLGGGITGTPFYEDIVGQILVLARVAARKQRFFRVACAVVGLGQAGLLFTIV